MNTKSCCVDSCTSSSVRLQDKGVTFHRLPKNLPLRSKWVKQARINNLECNKYKWNYICSRHFRKIDFEPYKASKFALKLDAIPTIFPWGSTSLEDLDKIFPPDEPPAVVRPRNSTDSEVKSDECKSSEEEMKSDTEQINEPTSMQNNDSTDICSEDDKPQTDVLSASVDNSMMETSVSEDKPNDSRNDTLDFAEDIGEGNLIIASPLKKKRGRKSNNERLLLQMSGQAPVAPKPKSKCRKYKRGFGRKKITAKTSIGVGNSKVSESGELAPNTNISDSNITDSLPSIRDTDKSILSVGGESSEEEKSTPIRTDDEKEATSPTHELYQNNSPTDIKELGALKVSEKSNYSPMLKALIEKKTPMTMPKKAPSASSTDSAEFTNTGSPKYTPATNADSKSLMVTGARVEAKDFSEQWYAARIMEVDHDEMEVLIHYDNWSQRYDEWISMSSPRLRVLDVPVGPADSPQYSEGERCLARWSDNRRFPATIEKILPDGKYEVRFDDGFTRTLRAASLSRGAAPGALSPPAGARPPPVTPPAPPHNHLFDPSRDHLGSKEERRHMKRKLNVRELLCGKQRSKAAEKKPRRARVDKTLKLSVPKMEDAVVKTETPEAAPVEQEVEAAVPPPAPSPLACDLSLLLQGEWSCRWVDNRPEGEAVGAEGRTVRVDDHRLPSGWTKFLTRRCLGSSAGKWDVVLVCPSGRRYRSRIEIRTLLGDASSAHLLPYSHCLQDFSVHRKLARRLGWEHFTNPRTPLSKSKHDPPIKREKKENDLGRATPPVKFSELKPGSPAIKKEKIFSPVGKKDGAHSASVKKERVASPLVKKERPASATKRERVASPVVKIKSEDIHVKVESPLIKQEASGEHASAPLLTTLFQPEPPQIITHPPLEDGFIYVGSLKVQVIENLLRCPKEGCFKNFRKDNFLQMHVKHYHKELSSFLGDTPNVADLAYARTITEDVTPTKIVDKPHKVKEKKAPPIPLIPKTETPVAIKEEYLNISTDYAPSEPTTPLKNPPLLDTLDKSPKLRTLLESKSEIKTEQSPKTKAESPQDLEDFMTTFRIKNDVPKSHDGTSKLDNKKPIKIKIERDITKSRVKSIISKIAAEEGKRSRSQSPSTKHVSSHEQGVKKEDPDLISPYELNIFPTPHKSKKKSKKRHSENLDYHHGKKRKYQHLDILTAFTDDHDDTRSSFGTPDMMAAHTPISTPQTIETCPISVIPKMELKDENNQSTFVTDTGEKIKIVHMKREEIINCHCGFGEEDGLMIQCELCLCWQHAVCHNIEKESEVPEKYVCRICLFPARGRRSQRHLNNQEWLYEGRLPRASRPSPPGEGDAALKRSHQLAGNLLHAANLLNSLRCKIQVSQKKDHPKLYLWSKPWDDVDTMMNEDFVPKCDESNCKNIKQELESQNSEESDYPDNYDDITIDPVKLEVGETLEVSEVNMEEDIEDGVPKCDNEVELSTSEPQLANLLSGDENGLHLPITKSELDTLAKTVQACVPQPEAAIDPSECRQRLLEHVERTQALLDARLDSIEAQIAELESQDPSLADDETPEYYPRTKQTIQMLLRDLSTMEELGMIS